MNRVARIVAVQLAVGWVLCAAAPAAHSVILYWSRDRAAFEPHSCVYAGSGWQYQGSWGFYLGTPIAPNYFITAKHIGGTVGYPFTYNGVTYTTTASYPSPSSDLQIWKVSVPFSTYAPLYTKTNEVGKTMTLFGRGTTRGSEVKVNGQTKGWNWGTFDHVQSWGSNQVTSIANGGPSLGQLLYYKFDASGDYYEGSQSLGDSGGGVFIQDGTAWKLAGINSAVEQYSYTGGSDPGFTASIFDEGGLYVGSPSNWVYVPDQQTDIPGGSYSTRISSNISWINSIIGTPMAAAPEPASMAVLLLGVGALFGQRRR